MMSSSAVSCNLFCCPVLPSFSVKALVPGVRDDMKPGLLAGGAGSEQNMARRGRPKELRSKGSQKYSLLMGFTPFMEKPGEAGVGSRDKKQYLPNPNSPSPPSELHQESK